MTGDKIVAIVAIVGALVLALRGLRARPSPPGRRLTMALIWIIVILVVVFIIRATGLELA